MIPPAARRSQEFRSSRGFTVLEAIVVLIITGLLTLVLVQGMGMVLAGRTAIANKILDLDQVVVERNLLLEPLRGLVPDYKDQNPERQRFQFKGDARGLVGVTIRPLNTTFGVPTGFRMYLDYDLSANQTALMYQESTGAAQELTRWPGDVGGFSYHDRTGPWEAAWPPQETQLNFQTPQSGKAPQTPWLVRLDTGQAFPPTLVVYVAGPHDRILRMQDMPGGAIMER